MAACSGVLPCRELVVNGRPMENQYFDQYTAHGRAWPFLCAWIRK